MTDWQGHARREATAVLAQAAATRKTFGSLAYDELVTLCAIAWLQGANYAAHDDLRGAEDAFDALKASL